MRNDRENIIVAKSFQFALKIVQYCEILDTQKYTEADETEYWLLICKNTPSYPENEELLNLIHELIKILSKIISTPKLG